MTRCLLRIFLPIVMAAAMSCTPHEGSLTGPDPVAPDYAAIPGVYDLKSPIYRFSQAWDDFTGFRYTGVMTVARDAIDPLRFTGSFTNFRLLAPGDTEYGEALSGSVRGYFERDGLLTIELIASDAAAPMWRGKGRLSGAQIAGEWVLEDGFMSGGFTAERRAADPQSGGPR